MDAREFAKDASTGKKKFKFGYWRGDTWYCKDVEAVDVYSAVKKSRLKNIEGVYVLWNGEYEEID